ncbi:MAG: hypothetical protein IJ001_09685 [Oscillospiraceae bacterium]|nr:hypothetical protein [Oscillospiraceae bacterium]
MTKKVCAILLAAVWGLLAVSQLVLPDQEVSDAERRPLVQMPEISVESLLDGSFMADFEDYSLDQFPLRDTFRKIKSLFHYYVLGQSDNNGIYIAGGSAVKQEYPLNESSVNHALERFNYLYDKYLTGSKVYMAIVPDKGYYLAEGSSHLALDYEAMFTAFREGMPWATHIDLTDVLSGEDYYRTDTHWRQENLLDAARKLCNALGVTAPEAEDYTLTQLERPFYGVYYGQAALPMEPDTIYLLESELLKACTVYDYESGKTTAVYDLEKLESKDLYDVFLSGARSLLTIENPNAATDRELIVFRDSFGSSVVPLLLQDYAKVTLLDIRYIQIDLLEQFVEFKGQDVLFLYSTLVLNNSSTIK